MGTSVLSIFEQFPAWHKLPMDECREMLKDIKQIRSIQETYALAASGAPKIIIAASGMASGGRVLTYFLQYLGQPTATVLLVGFQAEGTRGRALLEGAKDVKLFGKFFPVKAEIKNLEGLSAHTDQKGLIDWMSGLKQQPEHIFIIHGETQSADALRAKIKDHYDWESQIPFLNEIIEIKD
jgi:metallo-beta-lactamase family protein